MPRSRPASLRLEQRIAALRSNRHERVDGLSPHGRRIVDRLEVDRRWPGSTAAAFRHYRRWLDDPSHRLWDNRYGCGVAECCPDPVELREWLGTVAHHLRARDRRSFQTRLDDLDALW
jgi:hypothetical protein